MPVTQTANNATFLRNDNTWATVTPANIGAANKTHSHDDLYYTETEIDSKIATLNGAINGKAPSSHSHDDKYYTETEIDGMIEEVNDTITDNVNSLTAAINGKAPSSHSHDDRYYTETEMNTKLAGKSDTGHTHDDRYYTETEIDGKIATLNTAIDGKANASHGTHLTLGTGSGNAYYGDKGNTAYQHSQAAHAPSNAQKNSDITKAEIEARLTGSITSHSHNSLLAMSGSSWTSATRDIQDDCKFEFASHISQAATGLFPVSNNANAIISFNRHSGPHASQLGFSSNGKIYYRYGNGSALVDSTAWQQIYTSGNKPSPADIGAAASSHGTHVTWATAAPKANGTAAIGSVDRVAREDHVHPLQTTVSGNAGTATKLATARTITVGNKGYTFDGSADIAFTLAEIGASAEGHNHDSRYYTESEINTKVTNLQAEIDADVKVEADRAKAAEQALQANIDKKADASHGNHVPQTQTASNKVFLRNDNTWATITPANIGASATGHTHDDRYYTESEIDGKITTINTAISTAKSDAQKYADNKIAALVDSAPDAMNTLNELASAITDHQDVYDAYVEEVTSKLAGKSDTGHTHNYAGSSSAGGAATSANKVNQSITIKLNGGTTEGTNLFTFNGSAAKSLNITPDSIGAAKSSHGTHVTYASAAPLANAETAAVGSSSKVAREDHVHPIQTTVSGNAGSADKWSTGRTITIGNTGKTVDGSANVSWTLSEIGAAAASHGTHLTLGTGSGNAYYGDKGKVAYDHSQAAHAPSNAQKNSDITKAEIEARLTGTITSHNHTTLQEESLASKTLSLNDLTLSDGATHIKYYYCPNDGSGSNITGRPNDSSKQAFNLKVELVRWASTTDYITKQTYTQGSTKQMHVRYCTNGTWSSWEKVYTSAQKPTLSELGAAASSHGTHVDYASAAPLANGTAAVGSSNKVAREDHVHPIQTTVSGNAGTASKWASAITLTIGNKGKSVDGSGNVSWTLAEIGAAESGHTHKYAGSSSAGGAANSVANSIKVQLNGGTTEGTNQFTFNGSAAKTINITPSGIGAAASSHGTHVTYSSTTPKANGTAAVGSESSVARGDHVHPVQTSVTGNAGTATKLATARTITVNGVVSGSTSFDGSQNVTITTVANDITSINKKLLVGTEWADTGITGSDLATGTYAVQMFVNTQGTGGIWTEYFSGIMSWYASGTNSTEADEIMLHKAGHASNNQHIYLRTKRNTSGNLVLQIAAKTAISEEIQFEFKFKKLI